MKFRGYGITKAKNIIQIRGRNIGTSEVAVFWSLTWTKCTKQSARFGTVFKAQVWIFPAGSCTSNLVISQSHKFKSLPTSVHDTIADNTKLFISRRSRFSFPLENLEILELHVIIQHIQRSTSNSFGWREPLILQSASSDSNCNFEGMPTFTVVTEKTLNKAPRDIAADILPQHLV